MICNATGRECEHDCIFMCPGPPPEPITLPSRADIAAFVAWVRAMASRCYARLPSRAQLDRLTRDKDFR